MIVEAAGLFAILDVGMEVLKLLAVLGGASLGWLSGGLGTRVLGTALKRKQMPKPVQRLLQTAGGLLLGLATGLWVTGEGGGGFGFGPGGGPGPGGTEPSTAVPQTPAVPETVAAPSGPAQGEPPQPITLRVTLLGGSRVREQRFYLLEDDPNPHTLTGLRDTLLERRRQKQGGILRGIEIVVTPESVAKDHPAVRDLEKWARDNGLGVTMAFPRGDQS